MFRALDSEAIVATCENLRKRIAERFPGSGLSGVSVELLAVARETAARIDRLRRPYWPIRVAVILGLMVIVGATAGLAC